MWIVCWADDSHVMSSIISSKNYVEPVLKMSSASRDWRFKGKNIKQVKPKACCWKEHHTESSISWKNSFLDEAFHWKCFQKFLTFCK